MEKISAVYKITNTVTGDFYIGSSKNVKERWANHKCQSTWKNYPNNPLYLDMKKYGTDKFVFEILAEAEAVSLKEAEQEFIETLHPTYNDKNAKGLNVERIKKTHRKYQKSDKGKESNRKYQKSDKFKEYQKEYYKSNKGKESLRKAQNKYNNQLCFYNGETLTLNALSMRFRRKGIPNPTQEAKKYLIKNNNE